MPAAPRRGQLEVLDMSEKLRGALRGIGKVISLAGALGGGGGMRAALRLAS